MQYFKEHFDFPALKEMDVFRSTFLDIDEKKIKQVEVGN